MSNEDRFALLAEIAKLPEADKNFVIGYAAGVLAKTSEPQKQQKRRERKDKTDRTA